MYLAERIDSIEYSWSNVVGARVAYVTESITGKQGLFEIWFYT